MGKGSCQREEGWCVRLVKPGQYKVTLPLTPGFEFDMSSQGEIAKRES